MPKKVWKIGYKVIFEYGGLDRRSCTFRLHSVQYPKNKIAKRPIGCGPLTVFNTKGNAEYFKEMNWTLEWKEIKIVKCLYIPSKDKKIWQGSYIFDRPLPLGTRLADEVKCLE